MSVESDSKRRRVTLACNRCRSQKLRCDGVQPKCGRCVARQTACEYPKKFVRANVSEEYVRHLEISLGMVQKQALGKAAEFDQDGTSSENRDQPDGNTSDREPSESRLAHPPQLGPVSPSAFSFLCLVEAALSAEKQENVQQAEDSKTLDTSPPKSGLYIFMEWLPVEVLSRWSLPPRGVTDFYLQRYFNYYFPLCPFVHQPSFLRAYGYLREGCSTLDSEPSASQTLPPLPPHSQTRPGSEFSNPIEPPKTPPSPFPTTVRYIPPNRENFFKLVPGDQQHIIQDANIFHAMLNLIFALGCLHSAVSIDNENIPVAQMYYDKALEDMDEVIKNNGDGPSLILLQVFLLQTQFLQAVHEREACLKAISMAVRTAQDLGLYNEKNIETRGSLTERELCRRLWYGCLVMDRSISLSFGRPMVITQSTQVKLPATLENDYISGSSILDPSFRDQPSIMAFFEQTIKLYSILAEVLQVLYHHQYGFGNSPPCLNSLSGTLGKILEFDHRLGQFRKGLPEYFSIGKFEKIDIERPLSRKAAILRIRFLHVLIMLYRPILLPPSDRDVSCPSEAFLNTYMSRKVSLCCVDASVDLINILSKVNDTNILPAQWYPSFYVYTAAVIVLTAMIKNQTREIRFDQGVLDKAWGQSLKLVEFLQKKDKYVDRGIQTLKKIYAKIQSKTAKVSDVSDIDFLPDNSNVWGFDVDMLSTAVNLNTTKSNQKM